MHHARADDPDVRHSLRKCAGNWEALNRVVWHDLLIPDKARRLVGKLKGCRSCRSYEALLNRIALVLASANYFPVPMVLVVDGIEIDSKGNRFEPPNDLQEGNEEPWKGLYMDRNAVIWIARLNNINGRTWPWWEILVTYCHELVHHLDCCEWQVSDHTAAFYWRVRHLVEQLIASPDGENDLKSGLLMLSTTAMLRSLKSALV